MNRPRVPDPIETVIEELYRSESRRIFATLVRLLGDFDRAEEAMHDAFSVALERWRGDGLPANPRAWLISTGRFKAIDAIRRQTRHDAKLEELQQRLETTEREPEEVEDDRLRLIFTCCHPALPADVQVALTLREVCGLKTEEIASAFLTPVPTMAQRLVRGKAKIRDAGIPYKVPELDELPDRLDSVLAVIYLVFTEGYSPSSGTSVTRHELSREAIRLGRLLVELLRDPETLGLLALMLLQESRRRARSTPDGQLILLEEQDRSLWDFAAIEEGRGLVEEALASGTLGSYSLQAAIAAAHTEPVTRWNRVVALYDLLLRAQPSPIVALNRAVAVAMRDGPEAGLALIQALLDQGQLRDYHLAHAARADMLRRLGDLQAARDAYQRALELVRQEPERRFLQRRIAELGDER